MQQVPRMAFTEGDGTGSISSHIIYLATIQAWREAMGMDFVNVERPDVRMTALKWIYLNVFRDGKSDFWPMVSSKSLQKILN